MQQDLDSRLTQMLSEIAELRQQVTIQQNTINAQQSRLNELANQASTTVTSELKPTSAVSTSRRKVLRRLAGGMVAGLALGGVSLASGSVKEAEAAIVVNPKNGQQNVGAFITPPNQPLPTGSPSSNTFYGLIATDGSAVSLNTLGANTAVLGVTSNAIGVYGLSTVGGYGLFGYAKGTNGGYGVFGRADGTGGYGLFGFTGGTGGYGVYGQTNAPSSYGIYGINASDSTSWAGYFRGNVSVAGSLSKSGGSFKIDHPMDPANKYLYHSFVESPDMLNIYNGVVTLDANGTASVELPSWFESLNSDFRYALTPIGQAAPDLYIAEEVYNGQFKIAGGKAGQKVSWQLTGIRQDKWAQAHRIPVEEVKAKAERGLYIHPELFGQPAEKGLDYAPQPKAHPARPGVARA